MKQLKLNFDDTPTGYTITVGGNNIWQVMNTKKKYLGRYCKIKDKKYYHFSNWPYYFLNWPYYFLNRQMAMDALKEHLKFARECRRQRQNDLKLELR
jgi:hypothetical protein